LWPETWKSSISWPRVQFLLTVLEQLTGVYAFEDLGKPLLFLVERVSGERG
jgi:hypothetical protein